MNVTICIDCQDLPAYKSKELCLVCINKLDRPKAKQRNTKRRAERLIRHVCVRCTNKIIDNSTICTECKEIDKRLRINRKEYRENNCLCARCGSLNNSEKSFCDVCREKVSIYWKQRRSDDINFKLANNLRNRLRQALKANQKSGSAVRDLGCAVPECKLYLESKFQPGMSWDNWGSGPGKWQIDHIIPLMSFDFSNPEQFPKACHYTNLQPLWYEDHLKKTILERQK